MLASLVHSIVLRLDEKWYYKLLLYICRFSSGFVSTAMTWETPRPPIQITISVSHTPRYTSREFYLLSTHQSSTIMSSGEPIPNLPGQDSLPPWLKHRDALRREGKEVKTDVLSHHRNVHISSTQSVLALLVFGFSLRGSYTCVTTTSHYQSLVG